MATLPNGKTPKQVASTAPHALVLAAIYARVSTAEQADRGFPCLPSLTPVRTWHARKATLSNLRYNRRRWQNNLCIDESQVALQHDAVSREDGVKPALPRNCERNEICRHH